MEIKNVKYKKQYDENMKVTGDNIGIRADIDGQSWIIPLDPNDRFYKEILKRVEAGTLTIKDAE